MKRIGCMYKETKTHTHSHTPYTACAEIGTAIRMIKKE